MPENDLILQATRLLERLESLQENHRQCDVLLETYLRLSARLLWLRAKTEGLSAAPPSPEGGEAVPPEAPRPAPFAALEQELENQSAEADKEKLRLRAAVQKVLAELAQQEQLVLTAAPPRPAGVAMDTVQAALLEFVCLRNDVIHSINQLTPVGHATGVAGKSAVYFIDVPHAHFEEPLHLIAKFDQPERAAREWDTIRQLRSLSLSRDIILPEAYSHGDDGVILYRAARTRESAGSVTFSKYLRLNLEKAPKNCAACVALAFKPLGDLYRIHPGEFRAWGGGGPLKWRDALPEAWSELKSESTRYLLAACNTHWPGLTWDQEKEISRHMHWDLPRPLPNPIARVAQLLGEATHKLLLSRIHGDLNLTNLMVSSFQDGTPEKVFVIDLANSERDRPAALDFARLEVALWQETFLEAARALPEAGEVDWLSDMIKLRDHFDGRTDPLAKPRLGGSRAMGQLVTALRHQAFQTLAPEGAASGHYVLGDYFHCLYFTFLAMLRYKELANDPFQVRAIIVGAALTLQVIDELNNYSPAATKPYRRPWEHPPD